MTGVDDVKHGQQRGFGVGWSHIKEDQTAELHRRVGWVPDVHLLADLCCFAGHFDAVPLRVVKPAMITAAESLLLDPRIFQRSAAVRAMRLKRSDTSLLVAKDNYLFAEDLYFFRQVAQFVGGAYRLPITP